MRKTKTPVVSRNDLYLGTDGQYERGVGAVAARGVTPHPVSIPCQYTLSIHPVNTSYNPTLSTRNINVPSCQPSNVGVVAARGMSSHTLSTQSVNASCQHTLSIHLCQYILSIHPINPSSNTPPLMPSFANICPVRCPPLYHTPLSWPLS